MMEKIQFPGSKRWRCLGQLGIVMGLTTVFLWSMFIWLEVAGAVTVQAATLSQEISALSNGTVITIGTASALSGPVPDLGWQQVNAVQLAVSQTNAAGGLNIGGTNYTVTLVVADSGCDPSQAVTAANELLAAKAVAVVGHVCSSASNAAAPIYNTAGVAMVSPLSTAPNLTQQGYTTTFRTVPHDGSTAIALAKYFFKLGLKRTAILLRGDRPYSDIMDDFYQNTYTNLGGTVVSQRTIMAMSGITPALTAIQAENVEVILISDLEGDIAGQVSRVAHNLGMTQTLGWLGVEGFGGDYINTFVGIEAAENDYGATNSRRTSDMPGYTAFETAYLSANFANEPNDPGQWSPFAYDATKMIMAAIERANTTDTLAIRDALATTANYAGVVGTYQGFDTQGDVIPQWSRIEVVEKGEWVPALLNAEFYPDQGGVFDLENTLGQTTTLEIPANTVTETVLMTYTLVATMTNANVPTLTMIGEHAIRLEANVSIFNPMTVTIEYEDEDVMGAQESTLTFYIWNGSQWVDAEPCGGYIRDLDNNILKIIICHFSDYVLLGEAAYQVYLPLLLKP